MKRFLLAALVLFMVAGTAWAQDKCPMAKVEVSGYLAPNFRMIDKGEDVNSDLGFGLAFNRFTFAGMQEVGPIVKKIGWKVEADLPSTDSIDLIYAYVHAYFTEAISARFGHVKEAFGREWLHPTYNLLTADRLITPLMAHEGLDYAGYSYGLELHLKQEMFSFVAGAYDGQGRESFVGDQDPDLDFALRAAVNPMPELQIAGSLMLKSLPGEPGAFGWFHSPDDGTYLDDAEEYQTNSAMAWELDFDYQKAFSPTTSLWLQGEFGMGDNWELGADDPAEDDTWEDYEWFQFQYFYVKALMMATKGFGVYLGFANWDPNTDSDLGENDGFSKIVPGIVYKWSDYTRTQAEVQLFTEQQGLDAEGDEVDDETYTNFVLQQVLVW